MTVTSYYAMMFTRHARDHRSRAVLKLNKTPLRPLPAGLMIRRGNKEEEKCKGERKKAKTTGSTTIYDYPSRVINAAFCVYYYICHFSRIVTPAARVQARSKQVYKRETRVASFPVSVKIFLARFDRSPTRSGSRAKRIPCQGFPRKRRKTRDNVVLGFKARDTSANLAVSR